jgi:hypothetical protein
LSLGGDLGEAGNSSKQYVRDGNNRGVLGAVAS